MPSNPPTLSQPTVSKLTGGGGCSYILMCICSIICLLFLGLLIGAIVSFATNNTTGGIVCIVLLIIFCCICGGGGGASKAKTGRWVFVED